MHAALLLEPHRLERIEVPEPPDPVGHEVLVAVRRIGVCGTDFHAYSAGQNFFTYPRILGHELAVEVVAVGADVRRLRPGDLCAVMPYLACGLCPACRRGQTNCCERLDVLGVTVDGGMRERLLVPDGALYTRPDLSLDQLALVETLGIGMHAVQRADPDPEDSALVIGAGPIGLAIAQCVQDRVKRVVVSDINPTRLGFATNTLGLDTAVANTDLTTTMAERSGGDLPTLVFDATGSKQSMEAAFDLVGPGGTLVLVGHTAGRLSFANPLFHRREMDVRASRNAVHSEWMSVLDAVADSSLDAVPWITHRVPLVSISEEMSALAGNAASLVKAVVEIGPDGRP